MTTSCHQSQNDDQTGCSSGYIWWYRPCDVYLKKEERGFYLWRRAESWGFHNYADNFFALLSSERVSASRVLRVGNAAPASQSRHLIYPFSYIFQYLIYFCSCCRSLGQLRQQAEWHVTGQPHLRLRHRDKLQALTGYTLFTVNTMLH